MQKKGQVTVFLVLAVLVLAAGGLVVYLSEEQTEKIVEQAISANNEQLLQSFVESCLELVGEEAVYFTSLQGGYYQAPFESSQYFNLEIPHYWDNEENLIPTKEDIENEIALFVQDNLEECLNDLASFRKQGYIIERKVVDFVSEDEFYELSDDEQTVNSDGSRIENLDGGEFTNNMIEYDFEIKSQITSDDVLITSDYPITLIKDNTQFTESKFAAKININLNKVINLASNVMEAQEEDPEYLPLGDITALAYENKFTFETINLDDNLVFISFIIPIRNKDDLVYSFVHKYNWIEDELSLQGI